MSDAPTVADQPHVEGSTGIPASLAYDAFISYSHDDTAVAAAIHKGLHQIGRRMGQLHALKVFRDATDLSANPSLWGKVSEAMDRSRYLIVVLSPHAATSPWVDREVDYWIQQRGTENLLLVLAGGHLAFDQAAGRIEPTSQVAPPALTKPGVLPDEPLYVDVSTESPWDLHSPMFRDKVTDLAAPIHGKAKSDLAGEDLREQRTFRRLRGAAIAALSVLTILAVTSTIIAGISQRNAVRQEQQALIQRDNALSQRLASAPARCWTAPCRADECARFSWPWPPTILASTG